ncbi:HNH endonuclease [Demequina sp. SO4-13]|uniref:HNH endonuclease n=1 Tax=Demequina sp. SO4-13 TaxID=3401027 RepID=UPI003AF65390
MITDGPELRQAAFQYVSDVAQTHGGVISRAELEAFAYQGTPIKLIAPMQGINNPKVLDATISVVSSPTGPYADGSPTEGVWDYAYEGTTPGRTNIKLRRAYELGLPILYLEKIHDGIYIPYAPVLLIGDRPADLRFDMAIEAIAPLGDPSADSPVEKAYRDSMVRQRLHQPKFRARVLTAYATQCTVCHFKHAELLDAAHIAADHLDDKTADVTNGMAMCKIHHAAYDRNFLGVTPDYTIKINAELLAEVDGPMLKHGLQEMHDLQIHLPVRRNDRPNKDRLAARYAEFDAR